MRPRVVVVALLLAACSHGEPYGIPSYAAGQTLTPSRLTYNLLVDSEASWLPDGSGLVYSALRPDFPDTTFCIELLPPTGGEALASWCPIGAVPDSSRAYQAPAVSPGRRLLYLRSARIAPNLGWSVRQLVLAGMDPAVTPRVILSSPFPQYTGLSQIRWLTDSLFVFRADQYSVNYGCPGCPPYEASTGLWLVAGAVTGWGASLTTIPGTNGATSVAVAAADTILYTLAGDTRVYWRSMISGATGTRRDFAPAIADAVQAAGARLALTLNGLPAIADGAAAPLALDTLACNGLALSPDGTLLVAQRDGDLWEFRLP